VASTFDGMKLSSDQAVTLKLKSVEQRAGDTLWLRYEVSPAKKWRETQTQLNYDEEKTSINYVLNSRDRRHFCHIPKARPAIATEVPACPVTSVPAELTLWNKGCPL
jgi:hypothetical protein